MSVRVVQDGSTALHLAAWKNKVEVVRIFVSTGANYRAVKSDGQTALHEAAEAGSKEAVEYLLSVGANAQAQDEVRPPIIVLHICWHQSLERLRRLHIGVKSDESSLKMSNPSSISKMHDRHPPWPQDQMISVQVTSQGMWYPHRMGPRQQCWHPRQATETLLT